MERERNTQRDRRERCGEKKERAAVGAEGEKGDMEETILVY